MASSSGDRFRAARLLIRVEEGAFAGRLLDAEATPGLRARVLGVLRWRRALDEALQPHLKRTLHSLDPEVRAALRLGAFEAHYLGVPRPVATDAMVRLTRQLGKASAAGLVNAVLRRAEVALPGQAVAPDLGWSHPGWIWQRWRTAFGVEAASKAMAAAQQPAPPWVWFADDGARADVEAAGTVLIRHPWCPEAWTAEGGLPELMAAVGRGRAVVQDPSSQLVARLAAITVGGNGRVLDLCAAPGGKTALLQRLGSWASVVACDRSPAKVARLARRLEGVPVVVADAARPAAGAGAWDLVILDAPCTGTGTFRRHPELKWRLTPDEIGEASARQRPMIEAALGLLAAGGVLVYATCSVEADENEAHFEKVPKGFDRVPLEAHLPRDLPRLETGAGGIRVLPHEVGDGFTIHVLRQTG